MQIGWYTAYKWLLRVNVAESTARGYTLAPPAPKLGLLGRHKQNAGVILKYPRSRSTSARIVSST